MTNNKLKVKIPEKDDQGNIYTRYDEYPIVDSSQGFKVLEAARVGGLSEVVEIIHDCHKASPTDLFIMRSWKNWFKEKGDPFVVVSNPNSTMSLWKLRVV